MEQETVTTGKSLVGKPRSSEEMQTRQDPWGDAPFYGADAKGDKVNNIAIGEAICAVYQGVRVAKNKFNSLYLILETESGDKLRMFAPRHLAGQFQNLETKEARIPVGTYVEMTYRGMTKNPGGGDDYKHFDVLIPKELAN